MITIPFSCYRNISLYVLSSRLFLEPVVVISNKYFPNGNVTLYKRHVQENDLFRRILAHTAFPDWSA